MNKDSEQLTADLSLHEAQDQPLKGRKMQDVVISTLGKDKCCIEEVLSRKVLVFRHENRKTVILPRAVTYLGNPHPIFKKRIQLPKWFKDFVIGIQKENDIDDIRLLGVYHYNGNVVFVDFASENYLGRRMHNSSAHVYVNDLYQGMRYGIFKKKDANDNEITTVRRDKLSVYLTGGGAVEPNLFDLFRQFNNGYPFGEWLYALDKIREMHTDDWLKWRETEWAGWFLEYRFNKFVNDNNVSDKMRYISQKKKDEWDFDIRFDDDDFYGDLKASDITKKEAPGNDRENLTECICRHEKFWYIIYEHETIRDKDRNGEATAARVKYIKSIDPEFSKEETSYASRMKYSVRFMRMCIIELNRINYREVLSDFIQGRQPDGTARKVKFKINKNNIDNFVVFRYSYGE